MSAVVGIRANAGPSVGFGHISRCRSLCDALLEQGAQVIFLANPESMPAQWMPPGAAAFIEVPADEVRTLAETSTYIRERCIQTLVVDSYHVDERALARLPVPTVALVDAAPIRPLPVRLVVNSAADATHHPHLLAPGSRALCGLEYVLLRPGLASCPVRTIRNDVEHVLVTTGAGDERGCSSVLVAAARRAVPMATVMVIAGPYFSCETLQALEDLARSDDHIEIVPSPAAMASLMLESDVAVSAGGQTLYELAATGTPACAVRSAANQTGNLTGLAERGSVEWVGDAGDPDLGDRLEGALRRLAADRDAREVMSRAGRAAIDGRGASRVAAEVLELCR